MRVNRIPRLLLCNICTGIGTYYWFRALYSRMEANFVNLFTQSIPNCINIIYTRIYTYIYIFLSTVTRTINNCIYDVSATILEVLLNREKIINFFRWNACICSKKRFTLSLTFRFHNFIINFHYIIEKYCLTLLGIPVTRLNVSVFICVKRLLLGIKNRIKCSYSTIKISLSCLKMGKNRLAENSIVWHPRLLRRSHW